MIKRSQYGDLKVLLRLHFDASSVDAMVESGFLREIARRLAGDDERFVVHFHPLESFGSASKAELAFFADHQSESDAIDRLLAEAQAAGICGEQLPQSNPDALPTGESGHVVCYAASSNSFVIRSDGRVSKCTVAFDDERNVVGRILPTGDLEIDHNKHLPWLRGLISGDQASLGCPAAGLIWAV
jgi:uncharacterized protein